MEKADVGGIGGLDAFSRLLMWILCASVSDIPAMREGHLVSVAVCRASLLIVDQRIGGSRGGCFLVLFARRLLTHPSTRATACRWAAGGRRSCAPSYHKWTCGSPARRQRGPRQRFAHKNLSWTRVGT